MVKEESDKPKKPLSMFFRYKGEVMSKVREDNKDMKMGEIMKIISSMYGKISEEEKARLLAEEKEEKKVYDVDIEKYYQKYGNPKDIKKDKLKKKVEHTYVSDSDSEDEKPKQRKRPNTVESTKENKKKAENKSAKEVKEVKEVKNKDVKKIVEEPKKESKREKKETKAEEPKKDARSEEQKKDKVKAKKQVA